MDKRKLESLLKKGMSVRGIAVELGYSNTNVNYWIHKYGLKLSKWIKVENFSKKEIESIKTAVSKSHSLGEVLKKLGKSTHGSNYRTMKRRIEALELDTKHFLSKSDIHKKAAVTIKLPSAKVFCKNSHVSRNILKRRAIEEDIVKYECSLCNQGEIWNGSKLVLILDHINGINNDNRKKNLRFVCPNCASTLPTHCRGHKGLKMVP